MPKGIANLFSTLSSINLFNTIEHSLNRKGIKLELPETGKVQLWNSEGDMVQVAKEDFVTLLPEIGDYLIQFWWPQMDDISLKIISEGHLCECDIYLDGLNDCQLNDIIDFLISITLESAEMVGFVIDRQELTSECDWSKFFSMNTYKDRHLLETHGLKVYKEYRIKGNQNIQINNFEKNGVYVAVRNHKKNQLTLYLLH